MKKNLWIILGALSIASFFFMYQYFDMVVPFVRVKVTMNSGQARTASQELANKYHWDTQGYDVAVMFKGDGELQAFVELEGGGKQAFIDMIEKDYFQPYEWIVRFYKPGVIHEIMVGYTPDGKPYEFSMKIPEDQAGAALCRDGANEIAQAGASDWNVDLDVYDFVEHHSTVQPSGRIDHTFVYERHDVTLQEGMYRLRLKVCGDLFAQLDRSVKIPNEFERRYAQMFANNKLLASMAVNIMIFLYLFIIAFLVGIFFYRDRTYLFVREHLYMMVVFFALLLASSVNQLPLVWYRYPTHMSVWLFGLQALVMIAVSGFLFSIFVGILCVIVDAADRYMFGRHIQFLKSWSRGAGGSIEVLQMTVLGYVGAILALGYETGYSLWTQYMGWWAPLSTLVEPNILSSYLPFLSPIAAAFQAGFWEEFATRGLPLAGIAFLTRNSQYRAWWFGGMMFVQAIIFGALHANYPQMPAYYRVVELFLPSLGWGALYYWFGLLPGIIAHFVYDALLMCIPIWVSGLFFQKIACVFCILIPLWVVLVYWFLQKRTFIAADASVYNHMTCYQDPVEDDSIFHRKVGRSLGRQGSSILILFGLIGFGCFYVSNGWNFAIPNVRVTRSQAQYMAMPIMEKITGIVIDDSWTVTSEMICPTATEGNKFIWQNYGQSVYESLVVKAKDLHKDEEFVVSQGYVIPPYFLVSWKKFTGSVEERAQEVNLMLNAHDKCLIGIRHTFPEGHPGADLSEQDAQKLALNFIQDFYLIPASDLELVSSESKKHSERRDYKIVYKDVVGYTLDQGQGRITVKLSGDKLSEINRSIYAPESWRRNEQNRETRYAFFKAILFLVVIIWCLFAVGLGIRRYGFSAKIMVPVIFMTVTFAVLYSLNYVNGWVHIINSLSSSEPWMHQMVSKASSYVIGYLALGFVWSMLSVLMVLQGAQSPQKKSLFTIMAMVIAGAGIAGIEMFIYSFKLLFVPHEFHYEFINSTYPIYAVLVAYFLNNVIAGSVTMMALCIVARFIELRYHEACVVVLFMLAGIAMSDAASFVNIPLWIGGGLCIGVIWFFLYRCVIVYDIESVLFIIFGLVSCKLIPSVLYVAYPNILLHCVISFIVFFGLLIGLYRKI